MHIVAVCNFNEENPQLVKLLADALGITVFEARPRLVDGGPAVVANFADPRHALALQEKLRRSGFATIVIDSVKVRDSMGHFIVRRFEFTDQSLIIELSGGQRAKIPYEEIRLLLPCVFTVGKTETKTFIERKFSLGRTVLSGGIPMSKKVSRREEITTEEHRQALYLFAGKKTLAVFSSDAVSYDGLGATMKLTREQNFAYLVSELRRLCLGATYDARLLNRAGQARVLGPTLPPDNNLDLAAEILIRNHQRNQAGPL